MPYHYQIITIQVSSIYTKDFTERHTGNLWANYSTSEDAEAHRQRVPFPKATHERMTQQSHFLFIVLALPFLARYEVEEVPLR